MHLLQYLFIKSEAYSPEVMDISEAQAIAHAVVCQKLELLAGQKNSPLAWADWWIVGGGGFVDGDPQAEDKYDFVLSFGEDSKGFRDSISDLVAERDEEGGTETWAENSYIYDLENQTGDISGALNSLDSSWYLVPVHFHSPKK